MVAAVKQAGYSRVVASHGAICLEDALKAVTPVVRAQLDAIVSTSPGVAVDVIYCMFRELLFRADASNLPRDSSALRHVAGFSPMAGRPRSAAWVL